jgi:hypothetical protein
LLLSGCTEELGPERFVTTSVSGSVYEGKKPLKGGWIEFIPAGGTVGNLRSARIQCDGSFYASRVAVGQNAVRLVNTPIALPRGAQLFGRFDTPVRRRIPEHPDGALRIDLEEEYIRYQATRPLPPASRLRSQGAEP